MQILIHQKMYSVCVYIHGATNITNLAYPCYTRVYTQDKRINHIQIMKMIAFHLQYAPSRWTIHVEEGHLAHKKT